jgi:hypothetical protein
LRLGFIFEGKGRSLPFRGTPESDEGSVIITLTTSVNLIKLFSFITEGWIGLDKLECLFMARFSMEF